MSYNSGSLGTSNAAAIEVRELSKCYRIYDRPLDRLKQSLNRKKVYYHDFWALKDISFEIEPGASLGIVGRNGSGKSTLLQLLCRTLTPTSGQIKIVGRIAALLELGSGFNPEFSGIDNIFLNASLHGISRKQTEERLDSILAFADIGEFVNQPIKTYSSGMVVRLAFSVIAHVDADILVIDEALAVGDVFFTQKCSRFLKAFREQGTLLFVSHDMEAVKALCDRALLLDRGRLRLLGPTKLVAETYFAEAHGDESPPDAGEVETAACEQSEETYQPAAWKERQPWYDFRQQALGDDRFGSLVHISSFHEALHQSARFGDNNEVEITCVELIDPRSGLSINGFIGGYSYYLHITCRCKCDMPQPDVGFCLNDRTGQVLFGDNTSLMSERGHWRAEQDYIVCFYFDFPLLRVGEYTITAAVQEHGRAKPHIITWIHDALLVYTSKSSIGIGLSGVPMRAISVAEQSGGNIITDKVLAPKLCAELDLQRRDLEFRVAMTCSCRDCDAIPKVKEAGNVYVDAISKETVQVMHNGLKVVAGGYYGDWMKSIIAALRGHHEPQEEVVFHQLLQRLSPDAVMLELGSFWSYYSLWFLSQSPDRRRAICLEADPHHLDIGRRNSQLNGLAPEFIHGFIARQPSEGPIPFQTESQGTIHIPAFSVPQLLRDRGLERLDLLHVDTQGAELNVLLGCAELLRQRRIRFVIVSTHSYEISGDALMHQRCLALIRNLGGHVICEHDVHESFSGDGMIAASFDPSDKDFNLSISVNRYCNSLFPNPAYYVPLRPMTATPQ